MRRLSLLFIFILIFSSLSVYTAEAQFDSDGDGVDDSIDPNPYSAGAFDWIGYFGGKAYKELLFGILTWAVFFALFLVLIEQAEISFSTNRNIPYVLAAALASGVVIGGWGWIKPFMTIIFGPGALILTFALLAIVGYWVYGSYSKAKTIGLTAGKEAAEATKEYMEAVKEERATRVKISTEERALEKMETKVEKLLEEAEGAKGDLKKWFKELGVLLGKGSALSGTEAEAFKQQMMNIAAALSSARFVDLYEKSKPIKDIDKTLEMYKKYVRNDEYEIDLARKEWARSADAKRKLKLTLQDHHAPPVGTSWKMHIKDAPGTAHDTIAKVEAAFNRLFTDMEKLAYQIAKNAQKLSALKGTMNSRLGDYETHINALKDSLRRGDVGDSETHMGNVLRAIEAIEVPLKDLEKNIKYAESLEKEHLKFLLKEDALTKELESALKGKRYKLQKEGLYPSP